MELLETPSLDSFAATSGKPARCAERGVAAPFTTPLLFAARLRLGPGRAVEVLVPNPSGREGWFVLPWAAAREALQPSLADQALIEALKPLVTEGLDLQPAQLLQAARDAAATGLAGRAARRAALSRRPTPSGSDAMREFAHALETWLLTCPIEEDRRRATALAVRVANVAAAVTALKAASAQHETPSRLAWVMDGWALLALLWQFAPAESRIAVLRRSMALAPPAAEEMLRWSGCGDLGRMPEAPPLAPQTSFVAPVICETVLAEWLSAA